MASSNHIPHNFLDRLHNHLRVELRLPEFVWTLRANLCQRQQEQNTSMPQLRTWLLVRAQLTARARRVCLDLQGLVQSGMVAQKQQEENMLATIAVLEE